MDFKTTNVTVKRETDISTFISNVINTASKSMQCVFLQKGTARIDAKSILGILALGINTGDEVELISEDADILQELATVLESGK
ncbi:PTS HPr component phosphorylation site [compost metagenome]